MAEDIPRNPRSTETILNQTNRDYSQWSVEWSTAQIPGMDTGTGVGGLGRRVTGRRRLRVGSLALGALLAMHCRITASALTGGVLLFIIFLIVAVVMLANPLRHFEVFLGQWSISGPGRAFRIVPVLDGIGIAICINAIVRAINCCTIAAIAAVYVSHSVSDAKLPFTYCRDFELRAYEPVLKDVGSVMFKESRFSLKTGLLEEVDNVSLPTSTVGLYPRAWRNITHKRITGIRQGTAPRKIAVCKETYSGRYPPLFKTPAYNFFYVEVVQLRSEYSLGQFNLSLMISIICTWLGLWSFMIIEKLLHGRLIWNNIRWWFLLVPCSWVSLLIFIGVSNIVVMHKTLLKMFSIGAKEITACIADALEVALYIHSAGVGTELIHGKGLNFYANGHIDPHLNAENVWHSGLVLLLTVVHTIGGALCAIVDCIQPLAEDYNMHESNLWIIPMYSKCTSTGSYSHLMSTLIFGGLMFSYMTVAFMLIKTALHTIFEYRVKLVFIEQVIVGALILSCMALSLVFVTNGGIALLESVDALMTGIAMPFVCIMELAGILYVYRGHDFRSDINLATEENTCSTRINTQWHIIPLLTVITLLIKLSMLVHAEMPSISIYWAIAPLAGVVMATPIRACHNMYVFLRPAPRRGT